MDRLKMLKSNRLLKGKHTVRIIFCIGGLLQIIGAGLWIYTDSVIQGHKEVLSDPNLVQEEQWRYEGSLEWWRMAKTTTYGPLSLILLTTGICLIECSVLYAIVQPKRKFLPKSIPPEIPAPILPPHHSSDQHHDDRY